MRLRLALYGLMVMFLVMAVYASTEENPVKYTSHGLIALEAGQLVSALHSEGASNRMPIDHVWQQKLLLRIGGEVGVGERFKAFFMGQGVLTFSYPIKGNQYPNTMLPRMFFLPLHGEGIYSLGDLDAPWLQVGLGFFPLKYNPDVRNLGEFLFRTSTYPLYFKNDFDFPRARLLGLRLSSDFNDRWIFDNIHQDALFFSELDFYPAQSWGLGYIASAKIAGMVEIGAGVTGHNLFSVYGTNSSSVNVGYIYQDLVTPEDARSMYLDTIGWDGTIPILDTSYYSFRGAKAMVRLAFDPKVLIPWKGFGPNDLRMYAEACVVGLKNYKRFYMYPEDRMPIAFGINLPGFKIIDLINVEFEYLRPRFNLNSTMVYETQLPIPNPSTDQYKRHPWKYSLFIEKRFMDHIAFKAQVARDHYVPKAYESKLEDRGEPLSRGRYIFWNPRKDAGDWYWMLKAEFSW